MIFYFMQIQSLAKNFIMVKLNVAFKMTLTYRSIIPIVVFIQIKINSLRFPDSIWSVIFDQNITFPIRLADFRGAQFASAHVGVA